MLTNMLSFWFFILRSCNMVYSGVTFNIQMLAMLNNNMIIIYKRNLDIFPTTNDFRDLQQFSHYSSQ